MRIDKELNISITDQAKVQSSVPFNEVKITNRICHLQRTSSISRSPWKIFKITKPFPPPTKFARDVFARRTWKLFRSCFIYNSNVHHEWKCLFLASSTERKENIAKQKKIWNPVNFSRRGKWLKKKRKINLKSTRRRSLKAKHANREILFLSCSERHKFFWLKKGTKRSSKNV